MPIRLIPMTYMGRLDENYWTPQRIREEVVRGRRDGGGTYDEMSLSTRWAARSLVTLYLADLIIAQDYYV